MRKIYKKIRNFFILLEYALAGGMKGASDKMVSQKTKGSDGNEINQQVGIGGVFNDLLEERETQEVKELRDAYYRVLKEADLYDVELYNVEDESKPLIAVGKKRSNRSYFDNEINIYNPKGKEIRVIQDNKQFPKHTNEDPELVASSSIFDYDTTLTITRDEFTPRFYLEKFVNKVVVLKEDKPDEVEIDLYTTVYASQFGKVDALFISEIVKLKEFEGYKSDTTQLETISFLTDKAYNSDDLCEFSYKNIHFVGIDVYDGNFVIKFSANVVCDGNPVGEKYKTKELTEKYDKKAPKKDMIDVFTIARQAERKKEEDEFMEAFNAKRIKIDKK